MNEEERDIELDDRIQSWLQSVDFSAFEKEKEEEVLGRPCMNCSMRGRRYPPSLRSMEIPNFVLGRPRKRDQPNRSPVTMVNCCCYAKFFGPHRNIVAVGKSLLTVT